MTPEELTFITLQEPAPVISILGIKRWYNEKGELHRENDLPAVVHVTGSLFWYKNGKRHREHDLPAVIWADGTQMWYKNGKWHRENAPAITWPDGVEQYWENGEPII